MAKSEDIFGDEWSGHEVHTFAVKDGTGYYIAHTVDDTRTVRTQWEIAVHWTDGSTERTYATTPQELALWTDHLQ